MNCFLLNLGLESMPLRVERHCYNASKVAEYLNSHEKVAHVNYAGTSGETSTMSWRKSICPREPAA